MEILSTRPNWRSFANAFMSVFSCISISVYTLAGRWFGILEPETQRVLGTLLLIAFLITIIIWNIQMLQWREIWHKKCWNETSKTRRQKQGNLPHKSAD